MVKFFPVKTSIRVSVTCSGVHSLIVVMYKEAALETEAKIRIANIHNNIFFTNTSPFVLKIT